MRGFYGYRRHLPKRLLLRMALMALLVTVVAAVAVGMVQMKSLLTRLAISRVTNMVNQIVSDSVDAAIAKGEFDYDRMISFEKDNEGKITAVKSNMPEFNRLQSAILEEVLNRIDQVSSHDLSIPLGSLTGSNLLAGRGPLITVRMQSIGSSRADLKNEFVSAGINQTKHQINLEVIVDIDILVPWGTESTQVITEVLIADTIVVGRVPDTYLSMESGLTEEN